MKSQDPDVTWKKPFLMVAQIKIVSMTYIFMDTMIQTKLHTFPSFILQAFHSDEMIRQSKFPLQPIQLGYS